ETESQDPAIEKLRELLNLHEQGVEATQKYSLLLSGVKFEADFYKYKLAQLRSYVDKAREKERREGGRGGEGERERDGDFLSAVDSVIQRHEAYMRR
ncbi:hypothetical protein KIPB_013068, partial [Kipferlia bialata]